MPTFTRPCCPICNYRMTSDEETVDILGEVFHKECYDEMNEDLDQRAKEQGQHVGTDVRSDDNVSEWDV